MRCHGSGATGPRATSDPHVACGTAFNRLLALEGISVVEVSFTGTASVMVDVALRRRRLVCPMCSFSTWARYDTRAVASTWRHLDFGRWQVFVRAGLRRLRCPEHGVRVEGVPFAPGPLAVQP